MQVALRQPIPDHVDCGNCDQKKAWVDNALQTATVLCAAALVFPPLAEACAAASAAYIAFYGAFSFCLAIFAFCEADFNN